MLCYRTDRSNSLASQAIRAIDNVILTDLEVIFL